MLFHPSKIKTFKNITSIYPGKDNAVSIEFLQADNTVLETAIKKQEAELLMFLKLKIGSKLKDSEMNELQNLIEEYGDMKYDEGSFDASDNL